MNESKRTSQVLKRFRELYPDGVAWKFNDRIARSRPDTMFARGGRVCFIEFKVPPNELTPGQNLEIKKLAEAGQRVFIAWLEPAGIRLQSYFVNTGYMTTDEFCRYIA